MTLRAALLSTALIVSMQALAGPPKAEKPALAGTYRERGGCFQRTEDDEYIPCVVWDSLTLTPTAHAGRYAFELQTNMFATTQGGCGFEGIVDDVTRPDGRFLVAQIDGENACPITFKVDQRRIVLQTPEDGMREESCSSHCSHNANLYSVTFPRASRKAK